MNTLKVVDSKKKRARNPSCRSSLRNDLVYKMARSVLSCLQRRNGQTREGKDAHGSADGMQHSPFTEELLDLGICT